METEIRKGKNKRLNFPMNVECENMVLVIVKRTFAVPITLL